MQRTDTRPTWPTLKLNAPVLEGLACLNFTQAFIAEQLGIRQGRVSEWYKGSRGLEAVEAHLLTALLETAVTTAESEGDNPCLSQLAKMMLQKKAEVARAWLDLQKALNEGELPAYSKDHAVAVYERLTEQKRKAQSPREART